MTKGGLRSSGAVPFLFVFFETVRELCSQKFSLPLCQPLFVPFSRRPPRSGGCARRRRSSRQTPAPSSSVRRRTSPRSRRRCPWSPRAAFATWRAPPPRTAPRCAASARGRSAAPGAARRRTRRRRRGAGAAGRSWLPREVRGAGRRAGCALCRPGSGRGGLGGVPSTALAYDERTYDPVIEKTGMRIHEERFCIYSLFVGDYTLSEYIVLVRPWSVSIRPSFGLALL